MQKWRKIGAVMAGVLFAACGTLTSVQAGELETFRQLTEGSGLQSRQKAEITAAVDTRSVNLAKGKVVIGVIDEDTVYVYGSTLAYNTCERIDLEMYLEKSSVSGFASYKSYEYTAKNADSLTRAFYVDVAPGYYYRLRGYHQTYHNGLTEYGIASTEGVPVGK